MGTVAKAHATGQDGQCCSHVTGSGLHQHLEGRLARDGRALVREPTGGADKHLGHQLFPLTGGQSLHRQRQNSQHLAAPTQHQWLSRRHRSHQHPSGESLKGITDSGQDLLSRRMRSKGRPLVVAECVPGGTTTAQAVLTALGVEVAHLISGSSLHPPQQLKQELVSRGLQRAALGAHPAAEQILAAVGDPFQAFTAGVLVGAVSSGQPLLLGGGCQMLAVLALAMQALPINQRKRLAAQVLIGTTGWLADEGAVATSQSPFAGLVDATAGHMAAALSVFACGLRFRDSAHQLLRDYERGYVKEGVGAGALLLLAQLRGCSCADLVLDCERALEQLLSRPVTSIP